MDYTVGEWPPSRYSLDGLERATTGCGVINGRLALGGTLTDGERYYLHAWYDAVGSDSWPPCPTT